MMRKELRAPAPKTIPVALTVAGSDSGGGAGIQADLKTFAALRVHGTSVVTCLTAQNPKRILAVEACSSGFVREQLQAVFEVFSPQAVKTGMLYSAELARAVVAFLKACKARPLLVVDPVLVATSGRRLLQPSALEILQEELLPLATLVTPNLAEAEALTGLTIRNPEDMRQAARQISSRFGCAAVVKGGHLKGGGEFAVDIFFDGREELLLSAPMIRGGSVHGTGCVYAAAITALLARGLKLPEAVTCAKQHISNAIAQHINVRGISVLDYLP
jgi:hydroxymethylpyrimidine kinase/phosphomethylpyrimidine kinase